MKSSRLRSVFVVLLFSIGTMNVFAQVDSVAMRRTPAWMEDQLAPSVEWVSHAHGANMAFEWKATPVLYSFGLSSIATPWKFFYVTPPARFTGSVELILAGQVYPSNMDGSHFGLSATLLGHLPLIEYGEELGLNLGVSRQWFGGVPYDFGIAGVTSVFGFIEYNVRYAPRGEIWIHEIAIRMF